MKKKRDHKSDNTEKMADLAKIAWGKTCEMTFAVRELDDITWGVRHSLGRATTADASAKMHAAEFAEKYAAGKAARVEHAKMNDALEKTEGDLDGFLVKMQEIHHKACDLEEEAFDARGDAEHAKREAREAADGAVRQARFALSHLWLVAEKLTEALKAMEKYAEGLKAAEA